MSIREFIVFYTLTISLIIFIIVVLKFFFFEIEYGDFLMAWPLFTNMVSLFYNYLSTEITTYKVSLV
jgi:uncharacterized membrane protein YkgB